MEQWYDIWLRKLGYKLEHIGYIKASDAATALTLAKEKFQERLILATVHMDALVSGH